MPSRPGDPRQGRRWHDLSRWIIKRDGGRCARCGRLGADTAGHVLPVKTHPELAYDPDNLRAEHGARRTLKHDGFDCQGNYSAGADTGITGALISRDWFTHGDATPPPHEQG